MNAIASILLSRVVGALALGGAAAVPAISAGEPAAIPATIEEAVIQLIMAVAGIGIFYARTKLPPAGK